MQDSIDDLVKNWDNISYLERLYYRLLKTKKVTMGHLLLQAIEKRVDRLYAVRPPDDIDAYLNWVDKKNLK